MTTTRAPFLSTKYSGYYHSQVPNEDTELTHVGPGTPCGEYMRRFWQPVCYTDELTDVPVALKILGEELVAFRDFSGRIGLVEAHCPHRGTSLEFGQVSERGIRCCYHGWLFDVDGTILETPGEPAGSTFKDRLCHGAYPVHDFQGIVFAYMGPPEDIPAFPMLDVYEREGYRLMPGKRYDYPCNWLQIAENAADPVHASFLHTIVNGAQFTDEFGVVPNMQYIETPIGMVSVGARRIGDNIWLRAVELVQPNLQQVAPVWNDGKAEQGLDGPMVSRWIVPRDDTSTMLIELRYISESEEREPAYWLDRNQMLPAQMPVSDDLREQQMEPGDYEAQMSQRPIAIHGLEHLGTTDRGVTMYRRLLRRGIRAVQAGEDVGLEVNDENGPIATFCVDTTVHVPPAATPEEDITLSLEIGRRYYEEYLKNPPHQK